MPSQSINHELQCALAHSIRKLNRPSIYDLIEEIGISSDADALVSDLSRLPGYALGTLNWC